MAAITEPNLGLNHSWALDEDGWNTGMDANLKLLGAVVQLSVINLTTTAQPGSPSEGARYVIPSSHTWPLPAAANAVAIYANGAWRYITPQTGWLAVNQADGVIYRFTGSAWAAATGAPSGAAGGDLSGTYPNPQIAAGVIVNADIAAGAAIVLSKLAALTVSRALVSDGSGVISTSATTAAQIAAINALTNGRIVFSAGGALTDSPNLAYQTASSGNFVLQAANVAHVAEIIKGLTSQTADLTQWQNNAGTVLSCVTASGVFMPGSPGLNALGQATNPFSGVYLGNAATNNILLTGTATAARTATFPDASIIVAGSASALTSGRVPFVTTAGLLIDIAGFTHNGIGTLGLTSSVNAPAALTLTNNFSGTPNGQANANINFATNGGSGSFSMDFGGNMVFRNSSASAGTYFDYSTSGLIYRNSSFATVFNIDTNGAQTVTPQASSSIAQILKLAASATADAQQVRDSSNAVLRGTTAKGKAKVSGTITAAGTTGAQTINKPSGRVNFAAAATSLVVTCDQCNTSCIIKAFVQTNDSTMKSVVGVAASGSFTLYPNAAPTTETAVFFEVVEIV